MAVARMVCGDCGAEVAAGDRHCAQCGAHLENVGGWSGPRGVSSGKAAAHCDVCGHDNASGASYCESCGARLAGAPVSSPAQPMAKRERAPKEKKKRPVSKKFEPWQIAAGIGIVALVAFFVYTEAVRETPKGEAHVHENAASLPIPLQEIERLRAAAGANPSDAAALLRLANAMHDNALHDSRFLLQAIETYRKYLVLQPGNPDARVDLGICYFELGRIDSANSRSLFGQAIQEMETAFRSSPTHQTAAFNLGFVNLNAGNLEESNRWMKKAAELNPESELGQRARKILEQHTFQ